MSADDSFAELERIAYEMMKVLSLHSDAICLSLKKLELIADDEKLSKLDLQFVAHEAIKNIMKICEEADRIGLGRKHEEKHADLGAF